ncbi:hypothetical protein PAHAL_2G036100 [Panicum hallii]|uniref:Phytocyanin domain-containing protein n=1 Tax=Panicum hallii TaxID=206008 RepID=A0A2S3GVQ8_9POAL|nr:basic blue protein-like [Panicum hallii]PAN09597.1 hypothetical protein PAHAL_2G036100 [Panicum hallii]
MAAHRQVLLFLAVVFAVASLASATEWKVGDDGGWRAQFNKTGWADGKTFRVGDTLLFKYIKGNHTVIQVGKEDFAACNVKTNNKLGAWSSGNDVVPLDKPGKMWFFCSINDHCNNGMKLVINVVGDGAAPAPAPVQPAPPPSSAPVMGYTAGAAVAVAGAVVAVVLAF